MCVFLFDVKIFYSKVRECEEGEGGVSLQALVVVFPAVFF